LIEGQLTSSLRTLLEDQLEDIKKKTEKDQKEISDYVFTMFKGTNQVPDKNFMEIVVDAVKKGNTDFINLVTVASGYQKQSVKEVEERYQNEKKSKEDIEKRLQETEQREKAWKEVSEKLEKEQKVQNELARFAPQSSASKSESQPSETSSSSTQSIPSQNKTISDREFEDSRRPVQLPENFIGKAYTPPPFVNTFIEDFKKKKWWHCKTWK